MKSLHCSFLLKTALLIVPLALCFGGLTVVQAGGKDPLSPGPVRPGTLDYRPALPQGYLNVYSVSDEFNDGAYYAHSSYAIYSIDGRLFKRIENNISRTDEIIPGRWRFPLALTRSLLGRREAEKSAFALSSRQVSGRLSIWTSQKTRRTDGGSRPVIAWRVQAIRNSSILRKLG